MLVRRENCLRWTAMRAAVRAANAGDILSDELVGLVVE